VAIKTEILLDYSRASNRILCKTAKSIEAQIKTDGRVKSRHPGENRGPVNLKAIENTGFRLSPE